MPENVEKFWEQLNRSRQTRHNLRQIVTSLSLVVILGVFWSLKLTGIGIAGEAFCGIEEHTHGEECRFPILICTAGSDASHTHTDTCYELVESCGLQEHIHMESCYSDITADVETDDDWERSLGDMARGPTTKENVILVARSQLGYRESERNFQVDADLVRKGITRYGQWYGNPYGDWSAMFVSFCLYYAGAQDAPNNAGAEAMRLEWESAGLYRPTQEPIPGAGNLLFLQKGADAAQGANAVAIITGVDDTAVAVIEGDVDGAVVETQYALDDPAILGYGLTPEKEPILMLAAEPKAANYTVWLDGTDGGLGHLTGSPNTAYTVEGGSTMTLPAEWTSPSKYSYKLRGWYDVTNAKYYPAGAVMEVTGNAVLYADWVASTYDLGVFNNQVANTVSTNAFITTHMFDYNYLFNAQSSNAKVTVSNDSHSETWSMVANGTVNYRDAQTLNLIFAEADNGGQLSNPNNRSERNTYRNADTISAGILTPEMRELLYSTENAFDPATGEGVLGKTYLGTADHLFQIMDDKNDEHYGYYYYDSLRNALSYNQTNERFYVYEYLSATSDAIGSSHADFLPLNSPYANTNGKTVPTYTYDGQNGEYQGVNHYRYDTDYSGGNYNNANNVYTEFAYGMRSDINFFLPNDPGSGGNKDLYGNDIEFQFSGDDDLWVLIDGIVVLDIGGIHQRIAGEINFSTGEVTVKGQKAKSLQELGITSGDHTLTVLYMERGASMSNCSIYFNLVPRFGLDIQKEDVLTQELLDGTQFTVYQDFECTKPAELWASEEDYNRDLEDGVLNQFQSTFTVTDGLAQLWGLGSGSTYYIKETAPPNEEAYGLAVGVIRLTIEKAGLATYSVDVVADAEGNEPSKGFTVHGVDIDEETKKVYIVVTNAPETVTETTTVEVIKHWEDDEDHSQDYIRAYLTVTDPDGTVRRIREVTLSDENGWAYIWTNLPKYDYDTMTTDVHYGVEESYESGYYSTVRQVTEIVISKTTWAEALSFQDGETYILRSANGYLATQNNDADTGYQWVDEQTAKSSPNALWTTTVKDGKVKFTNAVGQTITLYYNSGRSSNFYARSTAPQSADRQEFSYSDRAGGLQIFYEQSRNNRYYLTGTKYNNSQKFNASKNQNDSLILNPVRMISQSDIRDVEDWGYQITNTPLAPANETSLTVRKEWVIPEGFDETLYHEFEVTVRLLANGVNTGRTVTLTLKNGWQGAFLGLPYKDEAGNVIRYTVEEVWQKRYWTTDCGPVVTSDGSPPTYSTVITNTYEPGGPMLPSTGSAARLTFTLCGWAMVLGALSYGIGARRKRERRTE